MPYQSLPSSLGRSDSSSHVDFPLGTRTAAESRDGVCIVKREQRHVVVAYLVLAEWRWPARDVLSERGGTTKETERSPYRPVSFSKSSKRGQQP